MEGHKRDEALQSLRVSRAHLEEFAARLTAATLIMPEVAVSLEELHWAIDALEGAGPMDLDVATLDASLGHLQHILPMMPEYSAATGTLVHAATTSGTSLVYTAFSTGKLVMGPEDSQYAEEQALLYDKIQATHKRPDQVRELLSSLASESTLRRFDAAREGYDLVKARIGHRQGAATSIRTLLDGVKGDLWAAARHHEGENVTWRTMAARLAPNADNEARALIAAQEHIRNGVYSDLSDILKDREGAHVRDLETAWTRTLDHIWVVMNMVDLRRMPPSK